MKFSPEFQPWRFLGFGFPLIFLLFFCTFCAWGDPNYNGDSDSEEDPFAIEDETDWSTYTTTSRPAGPEKTVPDSHKVGIVGGGGYISDRKFECRGADVSNLTIISCDSSITECQKKLACFINGTSCKTHYEVSSGDDCFAGQSYYSRVHSGSRTEKCLKAPVSWQVRAGIIKCTSSVPSPSSSSAAQGNTNPNSIKTTIDYFYSGTDTRVHLLSALKPPFNNLIRMRIGDSSILYDEAETPEPKLFYTNEEIPIACAAANFFIDLKSIKIEVGLENGMEHQIDPALYLGSVGIYGSMPFWYKGLRKFRVVKGIQSFACVGRRLDTFEIVRTTISITNIDPPSQLLVKSPNGLEFQVDSKIGCNLSPSQTPEEFKILRRKIFNLLDISRRSEFWITSPISFLRFQNITQGNFSCTKLQPDGNSKSSSNDSSVENFDYYFDIEEKKPRIEKPAGSVSTVNLSGHNHRSLVCKYTGNPMPYVIWLQNGKEIFYTVGTESSTDQPDFEKSVLHLPIENMGNSTEISSDSTDSNLKYSCVVQNHLGVDQLDFVIESDKNSASASASASQTNSKPKDKSNGLIYGLISCLFVFLLVGLGFNFIRVKKMTQRAVVTKCRSDENGEHCENVGEISGVNSGNLGNPSQNHTEIPSNGLSHGISIPSQFRSGEPKYKILNK